MQSVVKLPFTTLLHDSPLNRPTVFSNADLIYKNFNENVNTRYFGYSMNNNSKEENFDGSSNISRGERDEEQGSRKETLSQRMKTYNSSEPKDSNGESFRNKSMKRYNHVKSKVDSNLQYADMKRGIDRKTRDGIEDHRIEQQNNHIEDTRVHNDAVWRVLPPVGKQHNKGAVQKQHLRSFSASPHVHHLNYTVEPTKSLSLPSRSRSASTHDFRDTSIDMLLPSNFDSYIKQSESYQDAANRSRNFRFYRNYLENKKIADNIPVKTNQEMYNSSSKLEQTLGISSVSPPQKSALQHQEPVNSSYSTDIQPTQNDYFSKKNYHSMINEQYQNYLKSRKQYFLRSNTGFIPAAPTPANEIAPDNKERSNVYNFTKELPQIDKGKYIQTNILLDDYLQNNKISPVENKTTFEFPSFKRAHELSNSWDGSVQKQQDATAYSQTRSRSNSHGSHTIPNSNNNRNNTFHTPAEQLKLFQKLSITKSLPQIPQADNKVSGVHEDQWDRFEKRVFKNDFDVLPDLGSSKEKLQHNQLLSMSVPAYLNYSNNLLLNKKQTRQKEPLPILKKRKRVRIALEYNRVYLYTPEYC